MQDSAATTNQRDVVQVDIVSDVMCPWCIIGFKQLELALGATGTGARILWHPFELNPDMPAQGQNLAEHIAEKYGSTPEQSAQNRSHMKTLGESLGFALNFRDDSRIVNSFAAHQVLDFALAQGKQHPVKMALFAAHFTDGKDVSDVETLVDIAASVGLNRAEAAKVLASGTLITSVREKEAFWTSRGITGVPSMIFAGKYLVTGAQGVQNYAQLLQKVVREEAA